MRHQHPADSLGERIEQAAGVDPDATGTRQRIEITKTAIREVLKEWLDERLRDVGRWSVRGVLLLAFTALVYFILTHSGWSRS